MIAFSLCTVVLFGCDNENFGFRYADTERCTVVVVVHGFPTGRNIYRAVFKMRPAQHNELFLPKRMAYAVDLEDAYGDFDIPNTIIRSKADCPSFEVGQATGRVVRQLCDVLLLLLWSHCRHLKMILSSASDAHGKVGGARAHQRSSPCRVVDAPRCRQDIGAIDVQTTLLPPRRVGSCPSPTFRTYVASVGDGDGVRSGIG